MKKKNDIKKMPASNDSKTCGCGSKMRSNDCCNG